MNACDRPRGVLKQGPVASALSDRGPLFALDDASPPTPEGLRSVAGTLQTQGREAPAAGWHADRRATSSNTEQSTVVAAGRVRRQVEEARPQAIDPTKSRSRRAQSESANSSWRGHRTPDASRSPHVGRR